MASVYRAVDLPLPSRMPNAGEHILRQFQDLLAQYMPFTLVIDEQTAWGEEARVSKRSVCGSWGPIAGDLRYFADKFGIPRASIEGTQIPYDLVRRYAHVAEPELSFDPERKRSPLVLKRRVTYYGFDLDREIEALDEFPSGMEEQARHLIAEALARGEARHASMRRNMAAVEEVREVWRRSGGKTPRLGLAELTGVYERQLGEVHSVTDLRHAMLNVDPDEFVPPDERERYFALPDTVSIRDRDVEIRYEVEDTPGGPVGVARLRLPEKMARTLSDAEVPTLDRPVRFAVSRGQRGTAKATTLDELQAELERPFTEEELARLDRAWEERQAARRERKQRHRTREAARELRQDRHRGRDEGRGRRRRRRR